MRKIGIIVEDERIRSNGLGYCLMTGVCLFVFVTFFSEVQAFLLYSIASYIRVA